MNISERGLNLIKSYEGCRLSSYKCPSNKWTIGWGRTSGVYEGMVITQAQADQFLFEDVQRFVNAVNQYQSRFNFNQAEFDSLTSFTYNCGEGSLAAVMSCCNTKQEIAEECKLYNRSSDGQILNGLVRRREEEYKLFTSGASSSNNTTVAANNNCSSYHENGEFFFNTKVRIRTAPSLDVSTIATDIQEPFYDPGESVVYHTVHLNKEGYNWIQYNRTNGTQGYCAVRDLSTGERFGHAI
ncbi:glycoside hydrolase family protein [Clostridium sp.]|uniref:glycoside hydrolase family protein n=1 Tax=Clostridium sp. TaxID=1506 RepID=UPI003990D324